MKVEEFFLRFCTGLVAIAAAACSPGPAAIESGVHENSVIGGTPVQPNEPIAKHVVLLRSTGSSARHFCTGTLIRADLVLTAAHCLVTLREDGEGLEQRRDFEIVFSTQTMTKDVTRIRLPRQIAIHPMFYEAETLCQLNPDAKACTTLERTHVDNHPPKKDLAVIRLNERAPEGAEPVRLSNSMPSSPINFIVAGGGLNGKIPGGYFKTIEQARALSGRLDKFEQAAYFTWNPFRGAARSGWRTSNFEICLEQSVTRSGATGDSGGPLFARTAHGIELMGVYSTMSKIEVIDGRPIERLACYMDLLKERAWVLSFIGG